MDKKLVLYGSGQIGNEWLKYLGVNSVYAFADSDQQRVGSIVNGKRVMSINELGEIKNQISIFISTSYAFKKEIYHLLRMHHLNEQIIGYPTSDKKLYMDWDSYVDTSTVWEGRNALLNGGQLYHCSIGFSSYISANTVLHNVAVGRYTSVGPNVRVIVGQHPTRNFVSLHPIFYSTQQTIGMSYVTENLYDEFRHTKNGWTVEIGNDVWIGDGVTIMEGVHIADGTVVAAGANVVKDTEPYSIVGGNPSRCIRYRFSKEDIGFLQNLRWWDRGEEWVAEYSKYFNDFKSLKNVIN